jgi:arylsulfatase A
MMVIRLFLLVFASFLGTLQAAQRPNIIVFIADDLGMGDLQCYDETSTIPTPHINRIAEQGMRFTDAHSPAAVCTPTRFSLLTGLYPFRSKLDKSVLFSAYDPPLLNDTIRSLPLHLKEGGYATAGFGKWHLGISFCNKAGDGPAQPAVGTSKFTTEDVDFSKPLLDGPTSHGFDYWYGLASSINHGPYSFLKNTQLTQIPTHIRKEIPRPGGPFREGWVAPGWDDPRIGEGVLKGAKNWIQSHATQNKEQPFFLYYGEVAPHFPFAPPNDILGTPVKGKGGHDDKAPERCDMIVQIDVIVGELFHSLEDPNQDGNTEDSLLANTLFLLTSDNGASAGYYAPIRDKKGSIYEGGHRVPFVAHWPGKIPAGSTNNALIGLNDLYQTFAELSELSVPQPHARDSHSFLPSLLEGNTSPRPAPLLIQEKGASSTNALRKDQWKLILRRSRPAKLYDLSTDLKEENNVIQDQPEITQEIFRDFQSIIESQE